jgi:hypothetical protein
MALVVRRGGLVVGVGPVGTVVLGWGVVAGLRLSRSKEGARKWREVEEEEEGTVETGSSFLLLRSRYIPSGR